MPRGSDARAAYYPALDGLRAIAVALVIGYHLGAPHMGGGLLGVGVFFTLSGYLITSILLANWHRFGSLQLTTFWVKRARRLFPAVLLVMVTVLLATALVWPGRFAERFHEAVWATFYVANWAAIFQGQSYWAKTEGASPLSHLWSLSVEEQFYLFWPLLLLVMLRIFRGHMKRMALSTFALGTISMLVLALTAHPGSDPTRAYEGTDTRVGGLLWGCALAMLWHPNRKQHSLSRGALDLMGIAGVVGIVVLAMTTTTSSMFIYRGGIGLLTVATCATLIPAVHVDTFFAKTLGSGPLRWVGERTYGIYLWHMPVAAFIPMRTWYGNTWARGILVVACTVALASLSWSFVENPIRRYGFRGAWRRGVVSMSGGKRLAPPFVAWAGILGLLGTTALAGIAQLPQVSDAALAHQAEQKTHTDKPARYAPTIGHPHGTRTSCTSVVHIGDSTSEGFEDGPQTELAHPSQRIRAQYRAVGVHTVIEDIRGARSISEHFKRDRNGTEAVRAKAAAGYRGCWVIALGMNDAATIGLGGTPITASMRIDAIMHEIGDQPVLWVTPVTQAWVSLPGYQNANMQKFTDALIAATKKYPNLRVYDWASEALPHPEWFRSNDANHNNALGSAAKAHGIAQALIAAYPAGQPASTSRVVASH